MYVRKGTGGNKKQVLLRNRVATKALVLAVSCVLIGTRKVSLNAVVRFRKVVRWQGGRPVHLGNCVCCIACYALFRMARVSLRPSLSEA